MNWLFVVTGLQVGGMETYLVNFLGTFAFKGHRAVIVYHKSGKNHYYKQLRHLDVEIVYCPSSYIGAAFCLRLIRVIKKYQIHVVCDFRNDFSFPSLLAAKICNLKFRAALYRSPRRAFKPSFLKNLYASMLHRLTFLTATHIIANSDAVLNNYYPDRNFKNNKFAVVHNGVDICKFRPYPLTQKVEIKKSLGIDEGKTVIGHVGRFHKAKNHEVILKAFSALISTRSNFHLLLVGDGKLRPRIEDLKKRLHLSDNMTLTGVRADVPDLLNAMDIFFYPSLYEGLPNAVLEAMSCGLPVVASNIPEILDILAPADHPFCSHPWDVHGFVCCLEVLSQDQAICRNLAHQNMAWIRQHYTIEASARSFMEKIGADLP